MFERTYKLSAMRGHEFKNRWAFTASIVESYKYIPH
jgi:hypothetical protein